MCVTLICLTWVEGLLTKAPTFRENVVSRASEGEALLASLLCDNVSVSSLLKEEENPY